MQEEVALDYIFRHSKNFNVVSLGYLSRYAFEHHHNSKNYYMTGSMGLSLPFAIGLSKSSSNTFNLIIGEGSLFMNLGALSSAYLAKNLNVFVIDNQSHNTTGGQETNFSTDSLREFVLKSGFNSFNIYSKESELTNVDVNQKGKNFHVFSVRRMKHKPMRINIKLEDIHNNFKNELKEN